jgi:two-component system nitrogen regulation response regulator GlnG
VNLGAIAPTLVASELFGAVRGAYTGAVQSQEGYFRRAHGGTLLLDEVGEATSELQVMLLRALESGEIHPVGSQAAVKVDVRLLAATDADLEARVKQGSFRAPLLHRLAGYEIALPPLAERRDDVARLLVAFLSEELAALGESDRLSETAAGEPWLPAPLVARLARYDWPGNVRQLKNVARQLAIGSRGAERLAISSSVERILAEGAPPLGRAAHPPQAAPARRRPSEIDEDELVAALKANRWDLQATANTLRISRPSLYSLIESSPRVRKAGDLSPGEIAGCLADCDGDLDRMVERLEVSKKALRRRLRELRLA